MNTRSKIYLLITATLVIAVGILASGDRVQKIQILLSRSQTPPPILSEGSSRAPVHTPTADTNTWTTYTGINADEKFEFKYPKDILNLNVLDDIIILRHAIPFSHVDPCDMRDNPQTLEQLTDVDISIKFIAKDLGGALTEIEGSDFVTKNFYNGDSGFESLQTSPGFIDFIEIGSLQGYRVTSGVEGCGQYTYYFPALHEGRVLVVKRTYGELTSLDYASQTYRKLPGVIQPSEEEKIFHGIISTFKELGPTGPTRKIPEFEVALNVHDKKTIATLLDDQVWYILEATECCGWTKREQTALKISKENGILNFSEEQPLLQIIRKKRIDLKNYTIGIRELIPNQDANGRPYSFTAYHANGENKIDRIRIGLYP